MIKGNKNWQRLYYSSPVFLRNIFSSVYSAFVSDKKYGKEFKKWANFLKESNFWQISKLHDYQLEQLRVYIAEVAKFSKFYQKEIEERGINIAELDLKELKKFPVINKSLVKLNYDLIINNKYKNNRYKFSSSGTTGTLLYIYQTPEAYQREYAFRWNFYNEFGVKRKDKFAYFIGSKVKEIENTQPPFHIKDTVENGRYFSIFHLSEQNISHYIDELNDFAPRFIKGYPSAIYTLASHIKNRKAKIHSPSCIFTASEVLHNYQKIIIEEIFNCPVYQWYGQVETTLNIQECKYHKLHVMEEYGFLEVLKDDGTECQPGELGNAIATSYGNIAFPLIRYDTGDNVILARDQKCSCGRTGRIIESIDGRDEDILITPDGRKIGRLTFIFMAFNNVKESQIIQNSITDITIKVVPEINFQDQDKEMLIKKMQEYVGIEMNIEIVFVDSIPRTAGGKLKHVVNNMSF